ncbi:tRNA (adenosine(37)-N6)-threonylcarbamoyltransferase complex ATPase subunit type 1 TsaE [Paenibacillus gansuensis]|uniref:tRNA threonylcarbamoyladenosine biosynthesis protein TsaE n=1 Tax=Paenibacillus gansuensis TaxID=306542 RepID=A0ABW5PH38_9BACL
MSVQAVSYAYTAHTEEDTIKLAELLAGKVQAGALLALDGDLGAGKTRFSQAFAKAMGVPGVVNSPTFTIVKQYQGEVFPLYHMDVYRISAEEADELGLDEYFFGDGVTIVEWASIIEDQLPDERLSMYIEHHGGEQRRFRIAAYGQPYSAWCAELAERGVLTPWAEQG